MGKENSPYLEFGPRTVMVARTSSGLVETTSAARMATGVNPVSRSAVAKASSAPASASLVLHQREFVFACDGGVGHSGDD
jgi:hypothetical protein